MIGELEPRSTIEEAEGVIANEDNRNIRIKIHASSFINLHPHLMTMREMRRRKIGKVAVNEQDEDVLSALESRFKRIFDSVPPEEVELEISRREVQALGRSLPLIEKVVGEARRAGYPLSSESERKFPTVIHEGFIELLDSFVANDGSDNYQLRTELKTWVSKFK